MSRARTMTVIGGAAGFGVFAIVLLVRLISANPLWVRGAVLMEDTDPRKEVPIADVEISLVSGPVAGTGRSDVSGSFSIPVRRQIRRGQPVVLRFQHPGYQSLVLQGGAEDTLYVAHMLPLARPANAQLNGPEVTITNVSAQYSINTTTVVNVGSAVKAFEVVNTGNIPCKRGAPCSPDGKWTAAVGSAVLDAGDGNEFRNVRASCIAGPCPFTRIESRDFSRDNRTLRISALNWSDTATFLLEAEVFRQTVSDVVRHSYPVIFGRALNFTLPAAAEGVSIEAELNGAMIVFPLGPKLLLSWADCQLLVNKDQTKVHRCELKPGYRFP